MKTRRTRVVLPSGLAAKIDARFGQQGRSKFLAEVAARAIRRLEQLECIEGGLGAWEGAPQPELKHGSQAWVRRLGGEWKHRVDPDVLR